MSEDAALELGAEIVANSVTFIIGLMAIIMQQSIASATEKKKEKKETAEAERIETTMLDMRRQILDVGMRVEQLDAQLREMNRTIVAMKEYGKITVPQTVAKTEGKNKLSSKLESKS